MSEKLVTIIVPIYNVESFLYDCLNSIYNQSYKNFECLCINDGSLDSSLEIIKSFSEKDNRFILLNMENNGVGYSRNLGISKAKGEFIGFLDSDDCYHPEFLSTLINDISISNSDFSSCNFKKVNEDFLLDNANHSKKNTDFFKFNNPIVNYFDRKSSAYVTVWNKIYKSELIKNIYFELDIHPAEDDIFTFKTLIKAKSFTYNKSKLVYYRQRLNSSTDSFREENAYKSSLLISKVLRNANAGFFQKKLNIKASRRVFSDTFKKAYKNNPDNVNIYIARLIKAEKDNLFRLKDLSLNKQIKLYFLYKKTKKNNK